MSIDLKKYLKEYLKDSPNKNREYIKKAGNYQKLIDKIEKLETNSEIKQEINIGCNIGENVYIEINWKDNENLKVIWNWKDYIKWNLILIPKWRGISIRVIDWKIEYTIWETLYKIIEKKVKNIYIKNNPHLRDKPDTLKNKLEELIKKNVKKTTTRREYEKIEKMIAEEDLMKHFWIEKLKITDKLKNMIGM